MSTPRSDTRIGDLMARTGVAFGTSGARGLVEAMTDEVCFLYTVGFLEYLEELGVIVRDEPVAVAGDRRPSTPRILEAVARAVADRGYRVLNCGLIPTPALACHAFEAGIPSVMVTGSHIPDDRNGIKYNRPDGEILKDDEAGMQAQVVSHEPALFDAAGRLRDAQPHLPAPDPAAARAYVRRFLDFFPAGCLSGLRVGVYQHSAVGRELMVEVLEGLGAAVTALAPSEAFVPVDTEALRPEDAALARQWCAGGDFDALVSSDGDGDRPLVADERGEWLRGDVAGILCAQYLGVEEVVTPVSSNTAVERCGAFARVRRTRIGSPYVVAEMNRAVLEGAQRVAGYEANGGFLSATDLERGGRTLTALPTRDALIVPLAILHLARERGEAVSALRAALPGRATHSDRLEDFPTELSRARLEALAAGGEDAARRRVAEAFAGLGEVVELDRTDGLRATFASGEVVHLRPSGNAPELRCYNEADTPERAAELNRFCLGVMEGWRAGTP